MVRHYENELSPRSMDSSGRCSAIKAADQVMHRSIRRRTVEHQKRGPDKRISRFTEWAVRLSRRHCKKRLTKRFDC